ncbi:MAG TPA: TonB-dependent receptor [Planctomycetota bacterium]|nr:TonB-dependent receptor [Planctomycetota bacterium]
MTELDLDDLLNVRVTSPAKKEQPLTDVPAAITVIRENDVKRTGATSIAEALRGVPGLDVAQTNSNTWAISARGFNDNLANKMLVLIDGRSVYSPLHSGVYWDVQDTFLDDLDRIEVIRGPGGSLWGANAVNGVINVITKSAEESQGWLVTGGGGTEERAFGGARYGFKASDDVAVRVYAKYNERDNARMGTDDSKAAYDGWWMSRGGVRADWKAGHDDKVTFMSDYYEGNVKESVSEALLVAPFAETLNHRMDVRGADAILRWQHEFGPSSSFTAQVYYDYTLREEAVFRDALHTVDLDLQHRFSPLSGHDVVWGVGYRIYRSLTDGTFVFNVTPANRTDDVTTAFVQDDITIVQDRLRVALGSKFEYNDYSHYEYQPSARVTWSPDEQHTAWGSVSRAVRTPSIIDDDGRLTPVVAGGAVPIAFSIFGDHGFRTETLLAYEAGYRTRPLEALSIDLAVFYNSYDNVRSGVVGTPFLETEPAPLHAVIPINLANGLQGQTRGAEVAVAVQAAAGWLLRGSYTYLHMNMNDSPTNHQSPRQQAWVRSAMDLPWNFSFDVTARYVGDVQAYQVEEYAEADVRIAWQDSAKRMEAAVVGQNLVHPSHAEFQTAAQRSEIQRGVYASLTWHF